MIIAIDFDGTLVDHRYPDIGPEVPGAFSALKEMKERGHQLMLWTMRSGPELREAFQYCKSNGIDFTSEWTNQNPEQYSWTNSNKQYANIYIDDAALGCPLREHPSAKSSRPCVDWQQVMEILRKHPRW